MRSMSASQSDFSAPEPTGTLVRRLFLRTLLNARKSLAWAWLDVKCQYRRTSIGPAWETINLVVMLLGLSLVSPVAAHAMGEVAALDTMVQLSANDTQPNGTWSETAGAMSWLLDVSLHEVPDEPSGRRRAWYRACQRRGGRDSLPFAAIVPEPGSIPTLAPLYRTEQLQVDAAWRHPESRVGRVGGSRAPPSQHLH